jgi:hypothetical protein
VPRPPPSTHRLRPLFKDSRAGPPLPPPRGVTLEPWIDLFEAYPVACSMLTLAALILCVVAYAAWKTRGGDER